MNFELCFPFYTRLLIALATICISSANSTFANETDRGRLERWMQVETDSSVTMAIIDQCSLRLETKQKNACLSDRSKEENVHRTESRVRVINLKSVGRIQIDEVERGSVITFWPGRTNLFAQILYGSSSVEYTHVINKCSGAKSHQEPGIAVSFLMQKRMEKGFSEAFMSYVRSQCR